MIALPEDPEDMAPVLALGARIDRQLSRQ